MPSEASPNPTLVRIVWQNAKTTVDRDCPNCGAAGRKAPVLAATGDFPGLHVETTLLRCAACGCAFFDNLPDLDYGGGGEIPHIAIAFYTQQAAGISHIVQTLARVPGGPGLRYLDIGCGFGFGLDYAVNSRGWQGRGVDPSGMAKAGAVALGLPIENRYAGPEDAASEYDVVMASEVLEHIRDPREFAGLLRKLVRPGGSLVLTTPSAESVHEGAPDSLLIPVLSLGSHLVLQTPKSLELLLLDAGFPHVQVLSVGFSLTAYAADTPLDLIDEEKTLRRIYRDYLRQRLVLSDKLGDLWLGFATRGFQEAHFDRDWAECARLYAGITEQVRTRFGFDLDDPAALPDFSDATAPWQWQQRAPFSLSPLLYFRAHQRMQQGATPEDVAPLLDAARLIAAQTRAVLRTMNADDPLMEIIERGPGWGAAAPAIVNSRQIRLKIAIRDRFPGLVRTIRRLQGR